MARGKLVTFVVGVAWLTTHGAPAEAAGPPAVCHVEVHATARAAHVALYGGDFEALGRYAPQALAMAEEIGDEVALCRALNTNALATAWLTEDLDGGRALFERSATLGRQLGDNWALADGQKLTTFSWMLQDDYRNVAAPLAEFRQVAERLGNRFFLAWYETTVGWACVHQGDFARAERALQIALEEDSQLGGAATAGIVVALLGDIEALTGRYEAAEARLVPFLSPAGRPRRLPPRRARPPPWRGRPGRRPAPPRASAAGRSRPAARCRRVPRGAGRAGRRCREFRRGGPPLRCGGIGPGGDGPGPLAGRRRRLRRRRGPRPSGPRR